MANHEQTTPGLQGAVSEAVNFTEHMKMMMNLDLSTEELITDEKFDFDLPDSPNSFEEAAPPRKPGDEEEEVFFGPMGHREKCMSVALEKENEPFMTLTTQQMAEVLVEAKKLAFQLEHQGKMSKKGKNTPNSPKTPKASRTPKTPRSSRALRSKKFDLEADLAALGIAKLENSLLKDTSNTVKDISQEKKLSQVSVINKCSNVQKENVKDSKPETKLPRGSNLRRTFTKGTRPEVAVRSRTNSNTSTSTSASNVSNSSIEKNTKSNLCAPRTKKVLRAPSMKSSLAVPVSRRERSISGCSESSDLSNISCASAPPDLQRRSLPVLSKMRPGQQSRVGPTPSRSTQSLCSEGATGGVKKPSLRGPVTTKMECPKQGARGLRPPGKPSGISQNLRKPVTTAAQSTAKLPASKAVPTQKDAHLAASKVNPGSTAAPPMNRLPGVLPKSLTTSRMKISQSATIAGPVSRKGPMKGPMKAVVPSSTTVSPDKADEGESACLPSSTFELPANLQSTPVKQDKQMSRKRLLNSSVGTPRKSSESSESVVSTPGSCRQVKRRSLLPTPNKSRLISFASVSDSPLSLRTMSLSSTDGSSLASPMPASRRASTAKSSPAVGLLVDLCSGSESTPSCFKSRAAKVQHTPQHADPNQQVKRSIWSPIVRRRALSKEDEAFQCTKRTFPR